MGWGGGAQTVDWDVERECARSSSCLLELPAVGPANESADEGERGLEGRETYSLARRGEPTAAEKALVEVFQEQARRWLAKEKKQEQERLARRDQAKREQQERAKA